MNDVITMDSPTTTGGKVISGSGETSVNGKAIALVGDMATCTCGSIICRGQGPIVKQAPRNANSNGQDVAYVGDLVDTGCGSCFLLPSPHQVGLGTSMATPLNMGSGVNIGNGVNINMGSGISATSPASPPAAMTRQSQNVASSINGATAAADQGAQGLNPAEGAEAGQENKPGYSMKITDTVYSLFKEGKLKLDTSAAETVYAGTTDNAYAGLADIKTGMVYVVPMKGQPANERSQFPTTDYPSPFTVNGHHYAPEDAVIAGEYGTAHQIAFARVIGKDESIWRRKKAKNYIGFSFSTEVSGKLRGADYSMYHFHPRSRSLNLTHSLPSKGEVFDRLIELYSSGFYASEYLIEQEIYGGERKSRTVTPSYKAFYETQKKDGEYIFGPPDPAARGTISKPLQEQLRTFLGEELLKHGRKIGNHKLDEALKGGIKPGAGRNGSFI